ncbi:pentapeptide repeat-containing protein [Novispirillum itersonii]|uniref:pentapeptide repeat-containing protein n=1 Tax=Novispirillum itersonii TaxID=189 RepID=UPI0003823BA7|nr:hypothetical protein [Novispirillum itersonii]
MSGGIDQGWLSAGVSWLLNADPDTSPYRNVKDIVLFVGAALALYFTFRRMKAADEQNKNQTKAIEAQTAQIELSRRDQLSKRFTEAVKQLGDDKLAIRMGGIAELWAVATESTHPEDRIMVLDVLCAFVRNAKPPEEAEPQKIRPDVELAMNRLGAVGPYFPWGNVEEGHQPYRRDFSGAYLFEYRFVGMDLRNIIINEFEVDKIYFEGCNLSDSILNFNDIEFLSVSNSDLSNINLSILKSRIIDGKLIRKRDHGYSIVNSDLSGSNFTGLGDGGSVGYFNKCFHKTGHPPSGIPKGKSIQ